MRLIVIAHQLLAVNVENTQPLLGLAKLCSENPPVLMLLSMNGKFCVKPSKKQVAQQEIISKPLPFTAIQASSVFFFKILEFSLLESDLTNDTSFISLQMRMVVNSPVGENILTFPPAWSSSQFESFP